MTNQCFQILKHGDNDMTEQNLISALINYAPNWEKHLRVCEIHGPSPLSYVQYANKKRKEWCKKLQTILMSGQHDAIAKGAMMQHVLDEIAEDEFTMEKYFGA